MKYETNVKRFFENNEVISKLKDCMMIEEMMPGSYSANFAKRLTGGRLGASWYEVTTAKIIYTYQAIAMATITDHEKLPRVLALILAGGILHSDLDIVAKDSILSVFNETEWGSDLLNDFRLGISEESKFAKACMAAEYDWNPERYSGENPFGEAIEIRDSALDFLARVTDSSILTNNRAGWRNWKVEGLVESVADHTVFSEFVAILFNQIYGYGFDVEDLIEACFIDHLPNVLSGDITPLEMTAEERRAKGFRDFYALSKNLNCGSYIDKKYHHYKIDGRIAHFISDVGHVSTDFVAKIYGSAGRVDLDNQAGNPALDNKDIKALLAIYDKFELIWIRYSMEEFGYDSNFLLFADYLMSVDL